MAESHYAPAGLHHFLEAHYDLEELRTLCFELGVDYDSLTGEGKSAKARELITYCERHDVLDKLVTAMRRRGFMPAVATPVLPAPTQHFAGRQLEIERIASKLQAEQTIAVAVAIQGIGGVGKTALAQMVAHRVADTFPGEVLWLELGPMADAFTLLDRCAAFAGVEVSQYGDIERRASAVQAALRKRGRLLAVLDDVWDYESANLLMQKTLPAARAVLVTSRDMDVVKTLRCDIVRLDVLSEGDAIKLLADLLGGLGSNEPAARQVARLVEYLPLALELAAGQCDSPEDLPNLVQQLQSKPALHVLKMPVGESRQTSVEACLALSYRTLDSDMQRRFRALGAFAPAPFDLAAVQSVWAENDADAVAEALQRLSRRGLLTREPGTQIYQQHALLRAYALALSEQTGEITQTSTRHTQYYQKLAESDDWRATEAAFDQVAHGWKTVQSNDANAVIGYSLAVQGFFYRRGRWPTRIDWSTVALERAREAGDRKAEALLINDIGYTLRKMGRWDEALDYFHHSLTIRREIGDRSGEIVTLNNIGKIYRYKRQLDMAMDYQQRALQISQEIGDWMGEAWALNSIGGIHQREGRWAEAMDYYQRGLMIYQKTKDKSGEAYSLNNIGEVYLAQSQMGAALDYLQRGLAIRQEIGNKAGEAQSINNIGKAHQSQGQLDLALDCYQRSLAIRQEIGDRASEARMMHQIAVFLDQRGDTLRAIPLMESCLAIDEELGYPDESIVRAQLEEMRKKAQP